MTAWWLTRYTSLVPVPIRRDVAEPTKLRPRVPLNLRQVDEYSCLTCVAANILHILRVADDPDTRWIDREIGRELRREAQRPMVRRFLLRQGLALNLVCSYEPQRFLRDGIRYLRRFYCQEWNSSWEQHWTPHTLQRHQQECLVADELSTFGARMRTEYRQPTLADIHTALDHGQLVMISIDNHGGTVGCHAVLVYGRRRDVFEVYSPEISRNCRQRYRERQLDQVWLRSEGMTAVWRPESRRRA